MSAARRPRPTRQQFSAYQGAFDYFNRVLFDGKLRPVILNFSRRARSLGFFAPDRWEQGQGQGHGKKTKTTHEISLNPAYLKTIGPREVAATLVHEMAHLWQADHGTPSRGGYHNHEWANKMESIGLMPSSTGAPGGKRVGQHMADYTIEGGRFAKAFDRMPKHYLLPWQSWEPPPAPKGGTIGGEGEPAPAPPAAKNKVKYTCPGCGVNAWGKPELHLVCGDCEERLVVAEGRAPSGRAGDALAAGDDDRALGYNGDAP